MKPIAFDSWPLISFFDNEPSAGRAETLITGDPEFKQFEDELEIIWV